MRRLAALALLLTLTVACDNSTTTTPPPTTTSTTTPRTTPNSPQAPRVPTPLDATEFAAAPCRSLTDPQQKQFALNPGRTSGVAQEGNTCLYEYINGTAGSVAVVYAVKVPTGLSSRYAEKAAGRWPHWQVLDMNGYPAVAYAVPAGECNVAVGITDTLYFWVTAGDKPGAAKCSTSQDVASAVLSTLRTGH
ncbi:hypothetical protein ALI144C_23575 [Actinosynnema sp. ALI-1.44]|uniref:DUF3558 family protein n=1 Tax=Actinosynnema sp. ALI-1.44 TaxID=1933779 RepID=UPI00097BF3D3|nr:DUF3558 family protein [Actinosynnema sp. ALI-1.44]ONI79736.1 hypothetical protein ALI144C_23575 [Actinosynnema sp. ALI-1.44]